MSADQQAQRSSQTVQDEEAAGDFAGALDLLLTDGALGVLRRLRPDGAAMRLAASLAAKPDLISQQVVTLGAELAQIALGRSQLAPGRRDRRFTDPAWTHNPLLKRVVQAYLAGGQTAEALLTGADLEWRDNERLQFLLTNLIAAAAPSNNPLLSPQAAKALLDSGGGSAVRGLRALLTDLAAAPRVPTMVEPDAFEVGKDLAVTPGAVVFRTELFELIQYQPRATEAGLPEPAPDRAAHDQQVLPHRPGARPEHGRVPGQSRPPASSRSSWRNPDARHGDWDLDSYGRAIIQAMDATREVAGAPRVSVCALCSGGIVSSMVAAHLQEEWLTGEVASFCLGVTVLDQARAGTAGAMIDETTANAAMAASRARGYLDGRSLAEVFAWLRPDDLIWNYWVNNYLQGKAPPAFDILSWNADTTRLPAALHAGFIRLALANSLTVPDAARMLGSPVDLSKVGCDSYVIAGIADHLCPWQSCYRTTQLLGGPVTFVLSTSGHIASMVNPPGNPKATFQTAAENPPDPRDWLAGASTASGSWWPHYSVQWLADRSGAKRKARIRLGRPGYEVLCAAPGTYVHDR